jgi:hypothetical protein
MARALDPEQQRVANMRRRAHMLEVHARNRDPLTGKSALAAAGGRVGGPAAANRFGCASSWGLRMSLLRWHGVPLPAVKE